jgi:hypothetical protein
MQVADVVSERKTKVTAALEGQLLALADVCCEAETLFKYLQTS